MGFPLSTLSTPKGGYPYVESWDTPQGFPPAFGKENLSCQGLKKDLK